MQPIAATIQESLSCEEEQEWLEDAQKLEASIELNRNTKMTWWKIWLYICVKYFSSIFRII